MAFVHQALKLFFFFFLARRPLCFPLILTRYHNLVLHLNLLTSLGIFWTLALQHAM